MNSPTPKTDALLGHTPGPWEVVPGQHGGASLAVRPVNGPVVLLAQAYERNGYSRAFENNPRRVEAEANARLIAAAPELLRDNARLRGALADLLALSDARGYLPSQNIRPVEAARAVLAQVQS